jgi:hypothetical protein
MVLTYSTAGNTYGFNMQHSRATHMFLTYSTAGNTYGFNIQHSRQHIWF